LNVLELAGYAYYITIIVLAIGLLYYIWYVHTDKSRGEDYEKYGRLALDDRIDDDFVEKNEKKGD